VTVENGVGSWKSVASGIGLQTVRGTLSMNMGDKTISEDWDFQYMVGTAGASLQLDKMNVFYIGVDNPITVTAAGYSLEDVSINIPGANVTSTGKGKYNVRVGMDLNGKRLAASISAKTAKGISQVGGMEVRVKRIPDPVAKVSGKTGGVMPANVWRAQLGVAAVLENFDFDTKFDIVSFEFNYIQRRKEYQAVGTVNGAYFNNNPDVSRYMKIAAVGDRVYIDNIKARGPDGTTRTLNNISFLLN